MSKCLITGGTCHSGSYLAKRIIEDGNDVRVLVRKTSNLKVLEGLDVEIVYGDVTDKKSVFQSMKGIELVFHLAAAFREVKFSDEFYWKVNVEGTRNLLEASLKEGINRFLHCSTIGVLGHVSNPPANESSPYNPGDIYQKTKVEGEKLAKKYYEKEDLPVTVFRPAGIYGPGDTRFLRLFKSINSGKFVMVGKGEVYYHMVYVSDLIDGIILCTEKKRAIGETYIIAGEEYVTLKRLVGLIAEVLGVPPPKRSFPYFMPVYLASYLVELFTIPFGITPPIHRRRIDIFRKNRAFDITKAKNELGYEPKIDLETGIKLTAEWYKENGYL